MLSSYYKKKLDELIAVCKRNLSTSKVDENLITNAFRFALEAHKNEKRASGEPYFSHPYEVAMILAKEIPLDDITIAAALLHDVVEDTKFTINDLKAEFGNEIADIVDGSSQIDGISDNYELKQIESYKKMLLSMTSDIRVIIVKFADRLHNLRTLEFLPDGKRIRLAQETLEIFAPFAHRFGLSKIKIDFEDLAFKFLDRRKYDDIANKLKEKRKDRERFLKKFIEPIKERLTQNGYKFEIYTRPKHIYSIYRKTIAQNKTVDELYDLYAVRIILNEASKNDCFTVYGICSEIYIPVPERFKDYISIPKQNGYQSIHTTLVSKEGKMVEVQIRTIEMHEIAEKGIAAHWKYKENIKISDKHIEDWMKWVRETIESVGKDDYTSRQLIESFRLNLYQDEIYCFTPKGELKILPAGATPVDFAFEIHTEVGMKCIGAKVNGKIVPLNTPLKSGSQVEIITSKNQTPKRDWEKFVVTHKAKADIRKFFNAEKRKFSVIGKENFEKKIKKHKIHLNEEALLRFIQKLKYKDLQTFYYEIGKSEPRLEDIIEILVDRNKSYLEPREIDDEVLGKQELEKEKFISEARSSVEDIKLVTEEKKEDIKGIKYDYAKCCNPIPGDEVIGFITKTEGIKIHRKNCKNIVNLFLLDPNRIVQINWGKASAGEFTCGIKIIGEDKPGILNDITKTISKSYKVNIRSANIFTKGSMFVGTLVLAIENLKQLNTILEKINSMDGILSATRYND